MGHKETEKVPNLLARINNELRKLYRHLRTHTKKTVRAELSCWCDVAWQSL